MSKVLVINAGSSSMKVALLETNNFEVIASGLAERIGLEMSHITFKFKEKHELELPLKNHEETVEAFLKLWKAIELVKDNEEITHIGFRVVSGGPTLTKSTVITDEVEKIIRDYIPFAPLHNPGALQSIEAFKKLMPHAKLSATYDTAFHSTLDKVNYVYPIPKSWTEELGIRKFGFHGTSHLFITEVMQKLLKKDKVNIVNCHIGNGASLAAIKDSKSIDTSMGLTPLAGVMMGTRSGDVDPAIVDFVVKAKNISAEQATNILNKESGLKGVSQVSSDMRDVQEAAKAGNKDAEFALDLYAQKTADYLINYLNKIGPNIDAITFTAGVGENSASTRQAIIEKINLVYIKLDPELNAIRSSEPRLISTKDSSIAVYVVPTNEEYVIARDAIELG
ncbi:acetate kinase [Mycoplasmopsis agassizii]|uniref:Acetate kinase n=1 Tax=Mycoplasmopsis agassizii TaxID=33922 RepID=A0A269TJI6_9BACT|nr:acetate/propionate family kinase [Mycoplasmopsis agassizii]PAK21571.1 acetate kinase [Mycoplasmopsis agassizii]